MTSVCEKCKYNDVKYIKFCLNERKNCKILSNHHLEVIKCDGYEEIKNQNIHVHS